MNLFLRYMLEHYLVAIIAAMLKLYDLDFTSTMDGCQSVISILAFTLVIVCPFLLWKFLYVMFEKGKIKDTDFQTKFGCLVLDLHYRYKE